MSKSRKVVNKDGKRIEKWYAQLSSVASIAMSDLLVNQGRKLEGKILTLLDASITNPEQSKAVKDMFKEIYSKHYYDMVNYSCRSLRDELDIFLDEGERRNGLSESHYCLYINEDSVGYTYSRKRKDKPTSENELPDGLPE